MLQSLKYQHLTLTDRQRYRLLVVKSIFGKHGLTKIKSIWEQNYPNERVELRTLYNVWNFRQVDERLLEKLESLAAQLEDGDQPYKINKNAV